MKNLKLFSRSKKDPDTLTARSMILPILFCLVCGLLLIFFGNLALRITAYVLAGVMILCGVWSGIVYLRSDPVRRITESRLATGLILLVAGTMLAFNPNYLEDILPFIWGLALLFGGFLKIQYAFDEKSVQVKKWWIMLIFAAFSLIVGIIALLNPAFLGENRNLVIGILLVLEAVLDITVFFLLRHALKKTSQPLATVSQTFSPDEPVANADAKETSEKDPEKAPSTEEPEKAPASEPVPADNETPTPETDS